MNHTVCGYRWILKTTLDQSWLCNKTWLTIWTLLKLLRQSNFESGIQRQNSAKTVRVKSVNSCLQLNFWFTRNDNWRTYNTGMHKLSKHSKQMLWMCQPNYKKAENSQNIETNKLKVHDWWFKYSGVKQKSSR